MLSCVVALTLQPITLRAEEKWSKVEDNPVYLVNDTLSKGWKEIKDVWYFFDKDTGYLKKGWISDKGCWYYSHLETGAMSYGWVASGNQWYYMSKSNGIMQSNRWLEEGSKRFYLLSDGSAAVGVQLIDQEAYEFKENGEFVRTLAKESLNGWIKEGTKQYYYDQGLPLTGWQVLNGNKYYFSDQGIMSKGTVDIEDKTYKFSDDGLLIKEIVKEGLVIEANQYVYYENGVKLTGWQNVGNEKYYFDKNGVGIHGWFKISEQFAYFVNGKEIKMNKMTSEEEELILLINDFRAPKASYEVVSDATIRLATQIRSHEIITDFSSKRGDFDYTSVFEDVKAESVGESVELIYKATDVSEVLMQLIKDEKELIKGDTYQKISVATATYNQNKYWVIHLFKN